MNTTYLGRRHCQAITGAVETAGGTVPEALADILAQLDAVKDWAPAPVEDIASVIRSGAFTAANAAEQLDKILRAPTQDPRELTAKAEAALVNQFGKALHGAAGDAVIEAVRPAFEKAAKGIMDAREHITADTTPAQILELGDEAAKAWREVGVHKQSLDRVHALVQAMASDFDVLGQPEPLLWQRTGNMVYIAAVYARDENTPLEEVARWLMAPNAGNGGKWMRILSVTPLELNSLTRAREIIAAQTEERRKAAKAHRDAMSGVATTRA
ncbi:hypothetical protein [Aldersonia kunmingensis]|uniref:hypothetical protein n=1 Tax=Aldersonia kunmingensis TaxID=408066 RepID=UPI00082D8E12|nr:hypothetical protein [Aldersonia kunmingensis]